MPILKSRTVAVASAAAIAGLILTTHPEKASAIPWNLPKQEAYYQAYDHIKPIERAMQKNNAAELSKIAHQKGWQSITLKITLEPKSPPFYPYNLIRRDITATDAKGREINVNYPGLIYDRTTPLLPKGYRLPKVSGAIIDARMYKTYCVSEHNYLITFAARLPGNADTAELGITPEGKLPGGYTALSLAGFTKLFGAAAYSYMLNANSPNVGPNGLGRIPSGAELSVERCGTPEKAKAAPAVPSAESHGIVSFPLPPAPSVPINIAPPLPAPKPHVNNTATDITQMPTPLFIAPPNVPAVQSTPHPLSGDTSGVGNSVGARLDAIIKGLARHH